MRLVRMLLLAAALGLTFIAAPGAEAAGGAGGHASYSGGYCWVTCNSGPSYETFAASESECARFCRSVCGGFCLLV